MTTEGEANMIVRAVTDNNDYEVWRRLSRKYQPDTPMRRLQRLADIINVTKAKTAMELGSNMEKWEMKIKSYETETNHMIDDHIKAAALLGMCPHDLQDIAIAAIKKPDDYITLRETMRTHVNNRHKGPSPMDVGHVEGREEYEEEEENHIGALGKGSGCFNCGWRGHIARVCPTPAGRGEWKGGSDWKGGGKGESKGTGKGGETQWGKGSGKAPWVGAWTSPAGKGKG